MNLNLISNWKHGINAGKTLYLNEFATKDVAWKTRLLVRKFTKIQPKRFANSILPKQPEATD